MKLRHVCVIAASVIASAACRKAVDDLKTAPPPTRVDASVALSLPDALAGFTGSAEVAGAGYARRTYTRGKTHVDLTLAQAPLPPGGFASWVGMSRAFPQATLDAPEADANGFYQCTDAPKPSCDLLIQMRSGVHLELRGGGTTTRDDVDAVARALPLRALAAPPPPLAGAR